MYIACQNDLSLSAMPPPVPVRSPEKKPKAKRSGRSAIGRFGDRPVVAVVRAHPCIYNGRERDRVRAARRARAPHAPAAPALLAAAGAPRHRGADEEPAGTRRSVLERPRPCLERNARFHASVEREELLVVVSLVNVVAPRCVAQPGRRRAVASRTRQYAL